MLVNMPSCGTWGTFLLHMVPVKTASAPNNKPTLTERQTRWRTCRHAGVFTASPWLDECEPCTMNDIVGVLVGSGYQNLSEDPGNGLLSGQEQEGNGAAVP